MAKQSKKDQQQIKPELIGSIIQTKSWSSPITLENTPEILELCQALKLDVFITETSSPE